MNIIGLDLSLTATGIATPAGTQTFSPRPNQSLEARINSISQRVAVTCIDCAPDLLVIEGPVVRSSAAVTLGMLQGVVRNMLYRNGRSFVIVPPASVKKYATGRGNAPKPDLRVALLKRTGLDIADDNQVDAWWLRAMGMDARGEPLVEVPAVNRSALDKIEWPI